MELNDKKDKEVQPMPVYEQVIIGCTITFVLLTFMMCAI